MKSLWTQVREFIDMIDWWVAVAMLLILGLGLAVLVSVIRWLL